MPQDLRAYETVVALARSQDDAVTRYDASAFGMSDDAIALRRRTCGWTSPLREALLVPPVRHPLRAHARAATMVAGGVVCGLSAAQLHRLGGLESWRAGNPVDIAVPVTRQRRYQRRGCRRHWMEVPSADVVDLGGIPATNRLRTCEDVLLLESMEVAVSLLDAALHSGHIAARDVAVIDQRLAVRGLEPMRSLLALVDARAESPLETRLRLLLVAHGLAPDECQYVVRDPDTGFPLARLDFAWPARGLAIEADGAGPHSEARALLRDRDRQNALVALDWTVLRFTWHDVVHRPSHVVSAVRHALSAVR